MNKLLLASSIFALATPIIASADFSTASCNGLKTTRWCPINQAKCIGTGSKDVMHLTPGNNNYQYIKKQTTISALGGNDKICSSKSTEEKAINSGIKLFLNGGRGFDTVWFSSQYIVESGLVVNQSIEYVGGVIIN